MDKVTSAYFIGPANFGQGALPANVRGHHSSISKAVNAHRQMAEERTNRQAMRQMDANAPAVSFANGDVQMSGASSQEDDVSPDEANNYMEHEMIDPAGGPAKLAMVQAFQSIEPGRPVLGEPVPKGSYLDVEA